MGHTLCSDHTRHVFVLLSLFASVVGSQASITASFSTINQCLALGCFPKVKVIHTSDKIHGRVYIPDVNWVLMVLSLSVIIGFHSIQQIGCSTGSFSQTSLVHTSCDREKFWSVTSELDVIKEPLVFHRCSYRFQDAGDNLPDVPRDHSLLGEEPLPLSMLPRVLGFHQGHVPLGMPLELPRGSVVPSLTLGDHPDHHAFLALWYDEEVWVRPAEQGLSRVAHGPQPWPQDLKGSRDWIHPHWHCLGDPRLFLALHHESSCIPPSPGLRLLQATSRSLRSGWSEVPYRPSWT